MSLLYINDMTVSALKFGVGKHIDVFAKYSLIIVKTFCLF